MNPTLPEEAQEFAVAAEKAFTALGGVDAARRAEGDPDTRTTAIAPLLQNLGISELDPRSDLDTAAAAGELCRVAGRFALPYPVVPTLLRDQQDQLPFALVPNDRLPVDHGDIFATWRIATLSHDAHLATPDHERLGSKLGTFVVELEPGPADTVNPQDINLHITLTAWKILGTCERALELAVDHVSSRVQFGQPLAAFQAVQFQLADAAVATDGLRELARFTLWRCFTDAENSRPDALALRLNALDTARAVLRTAQQLHGAAGLCDEYDVSILVRHVQPDLRLPFGSERTAVEMMNSVTQYGFESLFGRSRDG